MSSVVQSLVDKESYTIERRVLKYDVKWGKPFGAMDYHQFILSANPIGYWKLENDATSTNWGTTYGSFDGSYVGSPTFEDSLVSVCEETVRLNGSDQYVDLGAIEFAEDSVSFDYSLSVWVKPELSAEDKNNDQYEVIVVKGDGDYEFMLILDGDNYVWVYDPVNQEYTANSKDADVKLTANRAHHIGVSVNTHPSVDTIELWINGQLIDTHIGATAPVAKSGSKLIAGALLSGSEILFGYFKPFQGVVSSLAVYNYALAGATFRQHYYLGLFKNYYNPTDQLDTAPVSYYTGLKNYEEIVLESEPIHFLHLDEIVSSISTPDIGTKPGFWEMLGSFPTISNSSALAEGGKSFNLDGDSFRQFSSNAPLQLGTIGERTAFSIEFWYRTPESSFSKWEDNIMSTEDAPRRGEGFTIQWEDEAGIGMQFLKFDTDGSWKITIPRSKFSIAPDLNSTSGGWNHVVFTVSESGVIKAFVNGDANGIAPVPSNGKGLRIASKALFVASDEAVGPKGYNTKPPFALDELAVYDRELTFKEIRDHYMVGRYGENYAVNAVGSDVGSSITGFTADCDPLPDLLNEEDVTEYVDSYTIDRSLGQFIDAGVLNCVQEWDVSDIEEKFKPNNYIKIQERYQSLEYDEDSDWLDVGHFLVEGPATTSSTADSQSSYQIALRGILKIATFDVANVKIEADKIKHYKEKFELTRIVDDQVEFKIPRKEAPDRYYYNWVQKPTARFYLSDFQNEDNPSNVPHEIRLKSAQGSVQLVGGSGTLRIDQQYLEDKIPDGLGNPETIRATFERYAVHTGTEQDDISDLTMNATVSGIFVDNGAWAINVSGTKNVEFPETMFVKSGDAKGKIFKISNKYRLQYADFVSFTEVTSPYTYFNGNWWKDITGVLAYGGNVAQHTNSVLLDGNLSAPMNIFNLNFTQDIPDDTKITGIEVLVRAYNVNAIDHVVRLNIGGVQGLNRATGANHHDNEYGVYNDYVYGGPTDTWGFTNLTQADLASLILTLQYKHSPIVNFFGVSTNMSANIDTVQIKFFYNSKNDDLNNTILTIRDYNNKIINPHYEGLAVGDTVQIGDANRPEDALRKIFLYAGLQETDSSRPFYFEISDLPNELDFGLSLPPQEFKWQDQNTWDTVLTETLEYAPPSYEIIPGHDGVIRVQWVEQKIDTYDHFLDSFYDYSVESSDMGVFTRVLALGEGGDSIDLAKSSTSAIRAYKLKDWAVSGVEDSFQSGPYGVSDYATMNSILQQVIDSSQVTPRLWGEDRFAGVLWGSKGSNVGRYTMEDDDLFVIDIGKNEVANVPFEVEAVQVTHINTYKKSTESKQSLFVYYMTEEDYISEFGTAPPPIPNQENADSAESYMPPANAKSWKLLLDEFICEEGETLLEASEFETGQATSLRFLKFTVGQSHFYDAEAFSESTSNNRARISLSDVRVFNSRNIRATATLGFTPPFESANFKELIGRMRLRTYITDVNYYLDTYGKASQFAKQQLREFYRDFNPVSLSTSHPILRLGETVRFYHPKTGEELNYLITSIGYDGYVSNLQLLDYNEGE